MTSPASFENQGFLVVEGTRGIAPSVILTAAQRGATVVFSARPGSEAVMQQLLAAAESAGISERVSGIVIEMQEEAAVERLVDAALERLPSLNVLIHNLEPIAVLQPRPLLDTPLAEWDRVLATELRVPFMLARRVVEEYLFAEVAGRIVYVGYSGSEPLTRAAAYAAAQSGLRALVRCITKEFGRRELAANAVIVHQDGQTALASLALSPNGHGEAKDPAASSNLVETVLFFSSAEASFVNGEFLDISSPWRHLRSLELEGGKGHVER